MSLIVLSNYKVQSIKTKIAYKNRRVVNVCSSGCPFYIFDRIFYKQVCKLFRKILSDDNDNIPNRCSDCIIAEVRYERIKNGT